MTLIWLVLGGSLLAWGSVWLAYDSPAVPLWKTRAAYRWLICGLIAVVTLFAWKLSVLHEELVSLIAGCR